jgi:hypothetical protein
LQFTGPFVTSLIISVGFSVDYCAHVVVAYLNGGCRKDDPPAEIVNDERRDDAPATNNISKDGIAVTSRSKLLYTFQVIHSRGIDFDSFLMTCCVGKTVRQCR